MSGQACWLFDLGNTRLKYARLEAGRIGEVSAVAHRDGAFGQAALDGLPSGAAAYLASVASEALTGQLLLALTARFGRLSRARTQATFGAVGIAYAVPERLGVDRFLALVGAHARGDGDALLVGVGSALTIDLIDAAGTHRGGRIAPSPALMREALHARAAQLPPSGGRYAEFAADTDDALASGCEGAAIALVERSLAHARQTLGRSPRLLLHGGGGEALRMHLPMAESAPALVLEGLARWADVDAVD